MPLRNILVALVILATSPAVPTQAAAERVDATLPPQGLYEGCSPGTEIETCIARLPTIRRAGFRDVLNYSAWYGSPAEVLAYADAASALGLRLIWPLNHPAWRGLTSLDVTYTTLLAEPVFAEFTTAAPDLGERSERNKILIETAIRLVAQHPATWGFYVGDELPTSEAGRVGELSAAVRRLAPGKPRLYIARPGRERLAPFAPLADVAGADTYPVGSGDPPVGRVARSARAAASAAGAETAMVLQAFSWEQYRPVPPTGGQAPAAEAPLYAGAERLRRMRDAAIRNAHPALILWYSYQDILRSDDPNRHWRDLTHAAFARSGH